MDYAEEQAMELEALEAILGDESIKRYEATVPSGWDENLIVYKIPVIPDLEDAPSTANELSLDILFQYTECYPEEVPHVKVSNTRGLSNADADELTQLMFQEAEENVGMASIYSIMQAAKEWLEKKGGASTIVDPATLKKQQEDEVERLRLEARAHGTPVTVESFTAWRKQFDAEMKEARIASGEAAREAEKQEKVTGRKWFLEKDRPEHVVEDGDSDVSSGDESTDLDFDDDDDDDDDEFLNTYLADAN